MNDDLCPTLDAVSEPESGVSSFDPGQPDLFSGTTVGGERDDLDRYFTPPWAGRVLVDYLGDRLRGVVWEPCAGDGSLLRVLSEGEAVVLATGSDVLPGADDIDENDFLSDPDLVPADWIVTNPPYRLPDGTTASEFVRVALATGSSAAFLLRLSWMEPCEERLDVLVDDPPTDVVVLPRVHYAGSRGSNNQTSVWYVWDRDLPGRGRTRFRIYGPSDAYLLGRGR